LSTFLPNETILHFCIFRYSGSVATHLKCNRIFIDSTINKFSPDSDSETSLKIGQYLMKLRRTKQSLPVFWAPCRAYSYRDKELR